MSTTTPSPHVAALERRITELLALDEQTFWGRQGLCSQPLILPVATRDRREESALEAERPTHLD